MIIDHVGLNVSDLDTSKHFYNQALGPLGISRLMEINQQSIGYGKEGKPEFWISNEHQQVQPSHIAFAAHSRTEVQAFYNAAIAAGGKNNGEPHVRPEYHANYFAAYVIDPDGHNIEVVCHQAPKN